MNQIGARVRALRIQAKETQVQCARSLRVSRATLMRVERGKRPGVELLARIADHFRVNMLYLIGQRATPERGVYLDDNERALLESYRKLSQSGKVMATASLNDLVQFEQIKAKAD